MVITLEVMGDITDTTSVTVLQALCMIGRQSEKFCCRHRCLTFSADDRVDDRVQPRAQKIGLSAVPPFASCPPMRSWNHDPRFDGIAK